MRSPGELQEAAVTQERHVMGPVAGTGDNATRQINWDVMSVSRHAYIPTYLQMVRKRARRGTP